MPRVRIKKQSKDQPVVVIAGAAGFVGSHLAESLLHSGAKVIGLDDLATGSIANMASFHRHPNFDFIECNVNRLIPEELYSKRVTHIVHAMGLDTHAPNKNATLASLLAGSFATKNLLDLAVKHGSVFLLTSSINIYEGLASSTSLDNYFGSTQHQKAQYSLYEAKRYSEGLCQMYAEEYNLDVRVARLSTVYGPRMDLCDDSFLDTLVQQTLDGHDLTIDEEGSQEVHLTYIDDAIYGVSKLMFAEGEQFYRAIYPIVSPEKTSIISVAYTLRTFLPPGKEVKFVPQSHKPQMPNPTIAFDRTQKDLDWEPQVSLTDGIRMTIESFRSGSSQHIRRHVVGRELFNTTPPKGSATTKNDASAVAMAGVTMHDEVASGKAASDVNARPSNTTSEQLEELVPLIDGDASQGQDDAKPQPQLPFRKKVTDQVDKDSSSMSPAKKVAETQPMTKEAKGGGGEPKVRLARKSWWKRLLLVAVLIAAYAIIGRPLVHMTAYGTVGGWQMYQGVQSAKALDFTASEARFENSSRAFADAQKSAGGLVGIASVFGASDSIGDLESTLESLSVTTDGLALLSQAAQPWPEQLAQLWPTTDDEAKHEIDDGKFNLLVDDTKARLSQVRKQLGRAQALLSGDESPRVAGATIAGGVESITPTTNGFGPNTLLRGILSDAQMYLSQAEQVLEVFPIVLGQDEQKRYLLMFQNNNELRPTGGFMGSYGVITAKNGQVTDFFIDDIYNPDGQLRSDISAPKPVTSKLGHTTVPLRDANWSPDIPSSAETIMHLYAKAAGVEVDGVVFITARAIKPILAELGPIHLQNFNETVTADNFYDLAQAHSNVGFVPGSTGKRDFLGVLSEAIMARIQHGGNGDLLKVGRAISQSLHHKEVQVFIDDPAVTVLLDQYDWSGRIKQTSGDYLRVVDANLGVNKSNYFVDRSTVYAVNVDRNSRLNAEVAITWNHAGTSGTWPGGDYLAYVRVYAPEGSRLIKSQDFNVDALDVSIEKGKQVFGGFVTVPYGSTKTVKLRYALPSKLGLLESGGEYKLLWQKQSGVGDESLEVRFNTPSFISANNASNGGIVESDGRAVWSEPTLASDKNFSLYLSQ